MTGNIKPPGFHCASRHYQR